MQTQPSKCACNLYKEHVDYSLSLILNEIRLETPRATHNVTLDCYLGSEFVQTLKTHGVQATLPLTTSLTLDCVRLVASHGLGSVSIP